MNTINDKLIGKYVRLSLFKWLQKIINCSNRNTEFRTSVR